MDRPDRPAVTLSAARGLPENPAQGRRNMANGGSGSLNNIPLPPIPNGVPAGARNMPSASSLSTNAPVSAGQVISMARKAMAEALKEHESQAAEASGVSNELKPGITIDLSRKNIQDLPDEIVDVIKHELERLALSHNKIASFPARFSECSSLRYLNVRNNDMREFPLPLCDLKSLEILDLGRNKLRSLPPEIVKLTSLKVFAVQKNRIEELPICLADMGSLQMIKLEGNPIRFPPPEVLQVQAASPPNEGHLKESEVTELTVTAHIKKFMKQRAMEINATIRPDMDMGGDESSEGVETPRVPLKRVMSGRFPVRVNGAGLPDLRSPGFARPPPIPTRSHYRGLSQQNTAPRKPGVMPLTIGNVNERVRSNSETLLQASRGDRPGDRSRRMGLVSQKAQQLGTLDETEANNRFSHYRGLSHGSAMQQGNGGTLNGKMPVSPAESVLQRPIYVRRLSILPERRRESKFVDPVLESAKGILYSIFQIHPMIQMLMGLTNDDSAKRSSLEIVFYNTNSHVEELEQEIIRHEADEDAVAHFDNENVQRACVTLVNAYAHVCSLLASNVDLFIDNGDPRYIRTLMMQLYNSIMELRVTTSHVLPEEGHRRATSRTAMNLDTIRVRSRESSATPTTERSNGMTRSAARGNLAHNPVNLRVVTTDVPIANLSYINGTGRSATITSATPRSGESFISTGSRGMSSDFGEEDRMFESIFLALQKVTDLIVRVLPAFQSQCGNGLQNSMAQRNTRETYMWKDVIAKCTLTIQQTERLKGRLSSIKLKEPGSRTQESFWTDCCDLLETWADFGDRVKDVEKKQLLSLPPDTRMRLRPIQKSMQEARRLIITSPWSYFLRPGLLSNQNGGLFSPVGNGDARSGGGMNGDHHFHSANNSHSHLHHMQLPMTPQSAALGPAVQATVPVTPQSASFAAALTGNVFERADALMSQGGPSSIHSHSRHGTFTSTNSSLSGSFNSINSASFNSLNSTLSSNTSFSSVYNDGGSNGMMGSSSSVISPGGLGGGPGPMASSFPLRMHNGSSGRVAM